MQKKKKKDCVHFFICKIKFQSKKNISLKLFFFVFHFLKNTE